VAGNIFTVQLSNASGSFATPVNLTPTLTATTGSSLKVGIPVGTASGTGYRVRIIGSNPVTTSADNGTDLTINPALPAPVINPLTNVLCNQLTINWQSVTGATNYHLEVAGNPSFTAPIAGSPFTVAGLTQVITGLTAGTTYYYRIRANGTPCNGLFSATQNATTPACPTITTTTVTPAGPYCPGGTITVDFTATGTFGAGNVFTVQLSNASGSFASPTNLTPTLSATTPASMTVTIPGVTPAGTGYRVRVVASNPVITIGTPNTTDLSIITAPSVAPTVLPATAVVCNGFTANWTAVSGATDYELEVDDDMLFGSPITGGPITVSAAASYVITGGLSSSTTYYYRVRAKNTCGNGPFSTAMTTTTAACPTITTGSISGSPFCAGASVTIPFTFTAGFTGTWTAEISTASGAFPGTVMTTVGTPAVGAGSGTIVAQIPLTTAAGSTYRIRVNNSAPGVSGTDNGVNLQVIATPIVVPGPILTVCRNAGPVTLTGFSPAGGTWSGASVTPAGVFTPSGVTITSLPQVVELTYTVTSGGCTNSAIRSIVLVDTPAISLSASPINVCLAGAPFNLTAAPFGGTWSGMGVAAGGLFTPTTAGVGTHTLTYSYTDGNGCVGMKTQQVVVNSSPNVSYTVTANPVCAGSNGSIELSGSEIGVSYQVRSGTTNIGSPVAGTGGALSLPVLASALTGPVNTFNILATPTAAACALALTNTATINVNIKPATTFTLANATVCNGSAAVLNLSGSEVGVSYQLKSPTNGNVVPAVLGTGSALTFIIPADSLLSSPMNFTLVATGSVGGCVSTFATPATVTKVAVPNVSFAVAGDSVCQGNAGQIRLSGSETGVVYSVFRGPIAVGTPVAGTGSALNINIAAADLVPGANTFEVRAANASCSATFSSLATITVTAAPSFAGITVNAAKVCLGNDGNVSINPSAIGVNYQLKAGSTLIGSSVGGTGSGINITIPAASLTAGINVFTLEAAGPSGCLTGFGSPVQVEVQPAPNTGYTYSADPVCPGQAARVVLSGSELGATYQLLDGITPVTPAVAGTGDSIVFTVRATDLVGGINSFTLEVKTPAGCATTFANPVRIEVKKPDVSFLLTGNKVCAGQDGEVLLSNSEPGVSYQLYRDGTNQPVGAAQTGTGSGLSFTVPASDLPIDGIAEFRMEACILGCKEFFPAVATITIIPKPAAPRASGAKRCDAGTVVLSATGGVEIRWYDVPAGGVWLATGSTFTTPVLTTTTTYYVASADGACESDRVAVEAIVFPVVKPIISSSATEIEINTLVNFTVTNPVAATRYEWYSDTTHVGSGVEFQMNFPNVGAFNIKVKAVDENLCNSESEVIVIKAGTKQSSSTFTGSPLIGVAPLEVQFKANSPAGTTNWFWEFGDSTTSTEENPVHVYTQVGFYTVTLTRVTGGVTIQETKTAYVQVKSVSGMDDLTEGFRYQLYPNPSDGRFEISTDNQSVQRLDVQIIDMSGKTILKSMYTGRKVTINKREIAGGVYTLIVNGVSTRLVVQ
jgi:PKD repeat protein